MPHVRINAPDGSVIVDKKITQSQAAAIANLSGKEALAKIVGADPSEADKVAKEFWKHLSPRERKVALHNLRKREHDLSRQIERERRPLEQEKRNTEALIAAHGEMCEWIARPLVLERPGGSITHHLRQEIADEIAHVFDGVATYRPGASARARQDYEALLAEAHIFVVQHEWAAAFAGAGDFAEGIEFRLPYEVCVFEFKVSGRSAAVMCGELDGEIWEEVAGRGPTGWFLLGRASRLDDPTDTKYTNGQINPLAILANFLRPQIKAICIALEAEVAETEVVRASHKLNRARERLGRAPASDYHVVSLAHRNRTAPNPLRSRDVEHGKIRLHFRRGHWRHYQNHRTWIRWTLVGNPDLGFVDKEYRL